MSILQAIGFMVLGGIVVEVFEIHAWQRYQLGKRENLNSYMQQRR